MQPGRGEEEEFRNLPWECWLSRAEVEKKHAQEGSARLDHAVEGSFLSRPWGPAGWVLNAHPSSERRGQALNISVLAIPPRVEGGRLRAGLGIGAP